MNVACFLPSGYQRTKFREHQDLQFTAPREDNARPVLMSENNGGNTCEFLKLHVK